MFSPIVELLTTAVESFDSSLQGTPAHQIVLATAAVYFLYNQYHNPWIARAYRARHNKTEKQRIIDAAYELAKNLPPVKRLEIHRGNHQREKEYFFSLLTGLIHQWDH